MQRLKGFKPNLRHTVECIKGFEQNELQKKADDMAPIIQSALQKKISLFRGFSKKDNQISLFEIEQSISIIFQIIDFNILPTLF